MSPPTLYIIDASSLIALQRNRPAQRNVEIWQCLSDLIHNERLIAPEEVFDELRAGSDILATWAKKCKKERRFFRRTTRRVVGVARQMISQFPGLVEEDRPVPQADPFVIALAISESKSTLIAPPCAVITEEKFTFSGPPRIPHVCGFHKMQYLTIHQMFLAEGWTL